MVYPLQPIQSKHTFFLLFGELSKDSLYIKMETSLVTDAETISRLSSDYSWDS